MATDYKGVSGIMPLVFIEDLSALATEADIAPYGTAQVYGVVMPFDGSIVGVSATHPTATTYDMTLSIQVSDVDEFEVTLPLAAAGEVYASYMPNTYNFDIGENITVTAKWATGVTADAAGVTLVTVFCQVGRSGS